MKLTWNPPKIESSTAHFEWSANYATNVHEDSQFPRPWTDITLADVNLPETIKERLDGDLERVTEVFRDSMKDLGSMFTETIIFHDWGYQSRNRKRFKDAPTLGKIDDSGDLANSQTLIFS